MNPLSLLPPPPSNFFSDLPSLPPSSPHHGTNTPLVSSSQRRTNQAVRVRVRVLFTARARIGRSTLKILFFLLAYIPNPHLLYEYCTRDTIVELVPSRVPCVRHAAFLPLPLLKFFPSPRLHFSKLFFSNRLVLFYPRLSARIAVP